VSRKSERYLGGRPLPAWIVAPARDSDGSMDAAECMDAHSSALELDEAVVVARLLVAAAVGQELPTPVVVWVLPFRRRRRCCACADPCREEMEIRSLRYCYEV
jgi:hypothetical protein